MYIYSFIYLFMFNLKTGSSIFNRKNLIFHLLKLTNCLLSYIDSHESVSYNFAIKTKNRSKDETWKKLVFFINVA